jgi:uncharacterized repeat protein (TIGR01451 family)
MDDPVTTRLTRRVLRTDTRSGMLALAASLALIVSMTLSVFSSTASAAVLGPNDNVGICHWDNGVKPYVTNAPNISSLFKPNGHDSHANDIIPSFTYNLGKPGDVDTFYPGKNLANGGQAILTNGCTAPATVTPLSPTVTQSVCRAGAATTPSFTIRPVTGVVYSVNGTPVTGTVNGTPGTTVTITVAPLSSAYTLSSTAPFVVTFTTPACPISVTPVAPSVAQSVCSGGAATAPSFTLNGPTGVVYSVNGNPVSGTVAASSGSTVTVTAAAAAGYVLAPGSKTSFTLTFNAAPSCTTGGPVVVTPTTPDPDNLGVSKTGTGTAQPGDELVWTLAVTNTSGAVATGFTVTDALPAGLSFSLAEGAGYTCNAALQVITCTYSGSLAVGQVAGITVRALLDSSYQGTSVSNTASLDPARADSNAADNSSTAVTTVTQPSPSPSPEFTGGGGGGAVTPPEETDGGGAALPFTGSHTAQLVQTGVAMFLIGWYFVALGRRRPEGDS